MKNISDDVIEKLLNFQRTDTPAVSLFIPLRNNELFPDKIFKALLTAANKILMKEGFPKLDIESPRWKDWEEKRTATLAIYHSEKQTLLLPLPIPMEPRFVVANSFHIKPVILARNNYIDALVLHFHSKGASLFRINPSGNELVDNFLPSDTGNKDWPTILERNELRKFIEFCFEQTNNSIHNSTMFVGITGQNFHELRSDSFWRRLKTNVIFLEESFQKEIPLNSFSIINFRLSQVLSERHRNNVEMATNDKTSEVSIHHLFSKIISGDLNYLCISLDEMQFGELDKQSGVITINRFQKNTKDDDVLDDLIELAISRNVKVNVVPKKYLPPGKSFVFA